MPDFIGPAYRCETHEFRTARRRHLVSKTGKLKIRLSSEHQADRSAGPRSMCPVRSRRRRSRSAAGTVPPSALVPRCGPGRGPMVVPSGAAVRRSPRRGRDRPAVGAGPAAGRAAGPMVSRPEPPSVGARGAAETVPPSAVHAGGGAGTAFVKTAAWDVDVWSAALARDQPSARFEF